MAEKHLILCGGAIKTLAPEKWWNTNTVTVQLGDGSNQLPLKIRHIPLEIAKRLPPEALDLLEIAAYVLAADQLVSRGSPDVLDYGAKWRRHFRLEIPVRCQDLWSGDAVQDKLKETLSFLSDDEYEFGFFDMPNPVTVDQLFVEDVKAEEVEGSSYEEVIFFSGGLDSLGGAVQEIVHEQRKVVLVGYRPVSELVSRDQQSLVSSLEAKLTDVSKKPLHVVAEFNEGKSCGSESTQRSQSFLFAALAALIARAFDLPRIRFYENGVSSINLPISPQAQGMRASRTTHPRVLKGFQELFTTVFKSPFAVENPFLWKTKANILQSIKDAGLSMLCAMTCCCTNALDQSTATPHCGRCLQCVDRRLSVLAVDIDDNDDHPEMYKSDVITGERDGADWTMIEGYFRTALEIDRIKAANLFLEKFPKAAQLINHLNVPSEEAPQALFRLHEKHATYILETLTEIVSKRAEALVHRIHPPHCLLSLAASPHSGTTEPNLQKAAPSHSSVAVFPTPPNARWSELTIKFLDGHSVTVTIGNVTQRLTYANMGMSDGRNAKPTEQWEMLRDFANEHGNLTWKSKRADKLNTKRKQILSKNLRNFFRIEGDPIKYLKSTKGWQTVFRIFPESRSSSAR